VYCWQSLVCGQSLVFGRHRHWHQPRFLPWDGSTVCTPPRRASRLRPTRRTVPPRAARQVRATSLACFSCSVTQISTEGPAGDCRLLAVPPRRRARSDPRAVVDHRQLHVARCPPRRERAVQGPLSPSPFDAPRCSLFRGIFVDQSGVSNLLSGERHLWRGPSPGFTRLVLRKVLSRPKFGSWGLRKNVRQVGFGLPLGDARSPF
jgi:hypothetical protein